MNLLIYLFLFIFGTAIGSFLNVLIDRLPKGRSINGRSKCDFCKKQLSGWDLIPVISFIILGGKCRYCHKKLSFYYPLVEVITGTIFVLIFNLKFLIFNQFLNLNNLIFIENFKFQISNLLSLLASLGIISCLIVIFFADLKYQIIPDSIQIIFFLLSTIYHLGSRISISQFPNFLVSGFLVMLPILFLWWVTKGKGMGFGDVKLAFNIGFLLGTKAGLLSLYFAFIVGAVIGLFLILMKKSKLKSKIAFGPFLVIGTVTMLIFENKIFEIIKQVYGF